MVTSSRQAGQTGWTVIFPCFHSRVCSNTSVNVCLGQTWRLTGWEGDWVGLGFLSDGEIVILTKDAEQVHGGPYRSFLLFP